MEHVFYRAISDLLRSGGSGHLLTILSGAQNGRDLTAQKAMVSKNTIFVQDEALRPFWEALTNGLALEPHPRIVEANGLQVLVERLCARQQLIICGGGHISAPLAAIGAMLDFDVTVIDDRPEFANTQRFPTAKTVLCQPFDQALSALPDGDSAYYVIVTRGHSHDRLCLEQILRGRFAYAGMIGSRRKVAVVMEQMEADGFSKALLGRVYAPIGLQIGAQSPAEIAVCIAAELVQVRSGAADGNLDAQGLEKLAQGEPMMLATIISKSGSAPRNVGAKMLVDKNGTIYGTIGGGAAEADVVAAAPEVLAQRKPRTGEFNMTNADAQNAGMVCGGIISVLLEPIQ